MTLARQPDHPVHPMFTERWSPRAFTGEAMPRDTLMTIFEAARWAPSSMNSQPWRFVYGLAGTPGFDALFNSLVPGNQAWAGRASVLLAVISATQWVPPGKDQPQPAGTHALDTGAAWYSLSLQAQLLGWHVHGMAGFNAATLRAALGVPDDHAVHAVAAIGRRGDPSQLPEPLQAREAPNGRKPLSATVAEGRFSFGG